jgi:hypothetical protein
MTKVLDPLRSSAASGSIGDTVYSRNQYGPYVRARTSPTQPGTAKQTAARNRFAAAVAAWQSTLSAADRTSWHDYARQVPGYDALGNPQQLSGFAMYLRHRLTIATTGLTPPTTAPINYRVAQQDPTVVIVAPDSASGFAFPEFDVDQPWANEDGGHLKFDVGQETATTVNFYGGPWQFVSSIAGSSSSPPSSPGFIVFSGSTYTYNAGNLIRFRLTVIRADGRLSATWSPPPTVMI